MLRRNRFHVARALPAIVLLASVITHAGEGGDWPEGWLFRATASAAEKAESYDITIEHNGLAQPDGRDVRVFSSDKKPVSHLISFADLNRVRIIYDGEAGPGVYSIYFGNLSPKLPPPPAGISDFGRKEWQPRGGFTAKSYDPLAPVDGRALLNLKNVMAYYETVIARAQAAEQEIAAKEPNPAKRKKTTATGVYANANTPLGTPDQWFHVFRAEINVPVAGKYDLVIGNGQQHERFGLVFLDGERANAAVPGWLTINFSPICVGITGQANLSAGTHVLEMYTNRRNPEIRMGLAGSAWKMPEYISGLSGHYAAIKLVPGEHTVQSGTLTDAYHAIISEWLAQERFTIARSLCKALRRRAAGNPELLQKFSTEFDRVSTAAYAKNWMTEGKYPSRIGAVLEANFAPPLKPVPLPSVNMHDDKPHASGSVWVEGRHIYGLPYNIQDLPWGVTSSICVEDDVLFVGTKNGMMHAVELSKATARWSFASGGPCLGAPLVYQGNLYYGGLDRRLYAVDIETGRMAWNFPANGWIEGGACAAEGRVYFGSLDGHLYAIDAALGIQRWKTPLNGKICATPTIDGKLVFVGTKTGEFFAVNAVSGEVAWKYAAGAAITGGCCTGNGRVIFGDASGRVHALDVATGKLSWNAPVEAGGPVGASPILVGNIVYGGTMDGKLFGIDLAQGSTVWNEAMPGNGEISRPPLFTGEQLIFTSKMRGLFGSPSGTPAVVAFQRGEKDKPKK
ncbi:MAG TPA: PQQ-binding-like beta-propeller repeat protein [Planctomycetota bacterium]|nr:PQQ-binding-like beta-propeller repeat protein [Planctomycetota bacterium]